VQNAKTFGEARTAETGERGPVGLVITGFENVRDSELPADGGDGGGHEERMFLTFNDTGTGDEKQLRAADSDVLHREGHNGIIRFQACRTIAENGGSGEDKQSMLV